MGGGAHAAGCFTRNFKSYARSGLGPVSVNQRGSTSDREEVQARIPAACAFYSPSNQNKFAARTMRSYCVCVCVCVCLRVSLVFLGLGGAGANKYAGVANT